MFDNPVQAVEDTVTTCQVLANTEKEVKREAFKQAKTRAVELLKTCTNQQHSIQSELLRQEITGTFCMVMI